MIPEPVKPFDALLVVGLFAGVYFIADVLLNRLAFSDGWTILWPLNGFSIAFLIRRPRSSWIWVVAGIQIGTAIGEWFDDNPLVYELLQRACSAAELLLCAHILPPFQKLETWMRSEHFTARLIGALLIGPGLSGVAIAAYAGVTGIGSFETVLDNWATADALGIAVTLPLALSLSTAELRSWCDPERISQFVCVLILSVLMSCIAVSSSQYPLLFLVFPALVFSDLLLSFPGSSITMLSVSLIAVWCATHGFGPFGHWDNHLPISRDHALQLFLGFHAIIVLPASAILMERRRLSVELKASHERLSMLANIDGLTAVANRRAFDEQLVKCWQKSAEQGMPLALALIDLDNFKAYNDSYGHASGDRCLKVTAQTLAECLEKPSDLVARFGGEEFVLLLPETDLEGARLVAERVCERVFHLALPHRGNPPERVTVSIGYASIEPDQHEAPLSLIQLADAALYRAKHAGRNRAQCVSTAEGLAAARQHFGETTRIRLLKLMGVTEQSD